MWLGSIGKTANLFNHFRIKSFHVTARARNGNGVQQGKEFAAQFIQEAALVPFAGLSLLLPFLELSLRVAEHDIDIADAKHLLEGVVPSAGHQVNLIAQVG